MTSKAPTIRAKPRGPVCEDTTTSSGSSPHRKAGHCHAQITGTVRLHSPAMVSGGMGLPARMAARLLACLQHPAHPMRVKTLKVALVSPAGAKTVTATTTSCASPRAHIPTTEEQHAHALMQALSDANMARLYLQKNDIRAAKRKALQLLKALQSLSKQPQGHTQQAQAAIKTVASKGGAA